MPIARAQVIFWQMSSAIAYCHEHRVAHRNLKPESIITSAWLDDVVKVSNFSRASRITGYCGDKCGTMPFVAPEVLAGRRYDPTAADVWSMGIVLLEMLCGINKIGVMLGWGTETRPSDERGTALEEFFQEPDAMLESVEADLGELADGLDEHLSSMLRPAPQERWTSDRVRDSLWSSAGAARSPLVHDATGGVGEDDADDGEQQPDDDAGAPHVGEPHQGGPLGSDDIGVIIE